MDFYSWVVYILAGLLGLCVGSFLNVVIYRVPAGISLAKPPSHCPSCRYRLKWYDNIPVLSYILLGGKCRSCKKHIPFRYTAVELANTVLWLLCVFKAGQRNLPLAIGLALVSSLLLSVLFIDLEHKLIFNRFVILLALAAIVIGFFDHSVSFVNRLLALLIFGGGFLIFWLIATACYKREVFGAGDVKLIAALSLLLGIKLSLFMMLVASFVGSVVLLILRRARGDNKETEYPFAPFIVIATWISLFVGEFAVNAYISLFEFSLNTVTL